MSKTLGWAIVTLMAAILAWQIIVAPPYHTCAMFVMNGPHKDCSVYLDVPSRAERWGWW